MTRLNIAVVGGGNGSYTMAGDLALAGHRVRMWPGSRKNHGALYRKRAIRVEGLGRNGEARLERVSDDPGEVIRGAELVLCTDPAHSQAARASIMAPHLENNQVVFLSPGPLGPIIHPVLFLLNTGAIEHFTAWDMHNEGTTHSVKNLSLHMTPSASHSGRPSEPNATATKGKEMP